MPLRNRVKLLGLAVRPCRCRLQGHSKPMPHIFLQPSAPAKLNHLGFPRMGTPEFFGTPTMLLLILVPLLRLPTP